jgi:predicted SAM-dependent methyltransferase
MKNYLNLGCGHRFHPDWTNVDLVSTDEGVIAHNLTQGLPFPDASFDVVYHSHVLEHFAKTEAEFFMRECCRVLRPHGVLRVVVPDLEQIAQTYLIALEKASAGSQEWAANYEWILLEMYDQTVRTHSGGEYAAYFSRENIPNEEFVIKRSGVEVKNYLSCLRQQLKQPQPALPPESQTKRLLKKFYRFIRYPGYHRELLLKVLLGKEYSTLQLGRFRQSGEVHQWMYDRYSLGSLLQKCGLQNIVQRTATDSFIPNWASFNIDSEPDGSVYKPDSLFLEAIKLPL